MVVAPTYRVDVAREVDLIEEVGRHFGFDKVPDTFPALKAPAAPADPRIRAAFLKHHADLLTPDFWQEKKNRILAGRMEDVFPYPMEERFVYRFGSR